MDKIVKARFQQRADTAANWIANNPVLLQGEIGCETDTGNLKVGDGKSTWTQLSYAKEKMAKVATTGSYNDLVDKPIIPSVPGSIKNPYALTFTGAESGSYDGSAAKSIAIPVVDSSLSADSTNAIQNKAVNAALLNKANKATTLAGYGITDAKISNGVITLGSSTITPLTSHQSLANYYTKSSVDTLISNLKAGLVNVVESLPTAGENGKLYLVKTGTEDKNLYTEYVYVNSAWEKLGTQKLDLSGYLTKSDAANTYLGINANAVSADKLSAIRNVSGGTDIILNFDYDGSSNSKANIGYYSCEAIVGNNSYYPYHRIAKVEFVTGQYLDFSVLLYLSNGYNGGGSGLVKLSLRTNSSDSDSQASAVWLMRDKFQVDAVQLGLYKIAGNTYLDVFYKSPSAYASCNIRAMASDARGRIYKTFTLVESSKNNDATESDLNGSYEVYTSIESAGTTLHNQAYTDIISAIDGGIIEYANNAGNADTAIKSQFPVGFAGKINSATWGNQDGTFVTGWDINGGDIQFRELNGTLNVITDGKFYQKEGVKRVLDEDDLKTSNIVKSISISGKNITVTKGDGSTDTLTTQDSTYNFSGATFNSGNYNASTQDANLAVENGHYYYVMNGPEQSIGATTYYGALYAQAYNAQWVAQIAQDYINGRLFVRGKKQDEWQPWVKVIDSNSKATSSDYGIVRTRTLTNRSSSGWVDWNIDSQYVPDMAFLAYWNGAYSENGASNLLYCNLGAFGTAATHNVGDFATANHTHDYLPLSGGTMTGSIIGKTQQGRWLTGKDPNNAAIQFSTTDYNSYWSFMGGKTAESNTWSFGGLGEDIGFYCYNKDRVDNGYDYRVTFNTSNGILYSQNGFQGNLIGTANNAVNDNAGRNISSTYIKALSVSGQTITYIKGDDSTGTITTQDTNTTYGAASAYDFGLVKIGNNITNSYGTISITRDNVINALGYTPPTTNTTVKMVVY